MRMCSTLALISCNNAALRGRREGGGGRDMYVEKESAGTVGNVNVGLREGGEEIYMHVDTDMHIYILCIALT